MIWNNGKSGLILYIDDQGKFIKHITERNLQ